MVITELWDKMVASKDQQKDMFEASSKKLPVGFVATPEDVRTIDNHMLPYVKADSKLDRGSVSLLCKSETNACDFSVTDSDLRSEPITRMVP